MTNNIKLIYDKLIKSIGVEKEYKISISRCNIITIEGEKIIYTSDLKKIMEIVNEKLELSQSFIITSEDNKPNILIG